MLLVSLILTLLVGAIIVALADRVGRPLVRWVALVTTILDFILAIALVFLVQKSPVTIVLPWMRAFGANIHLQADGLAALMVLLTTGLGVVGVLISWDEIDRRAGSFYVWLLLLQVGILTVFLARDALLFYLGWELMLIPLFLIIGIWGHEDKQRAAYKFLLFTFGGSIFMLAAILYVYVGRIGQGLPASFAIDDLVQTKLTADEQWWVFLGLFVAFAVKIPLFPLHTWLPDAHTQAPTAGSLVLAGVLLKTGVYGLIRLAMPMAPQAAEAFAPLLIALSFIGIYYGAIVAFAQRDFKRLVAYSSISHLGFVVLGLFVGNAAGYQGAVLQMVNHGLATGGLFLLAGILQHRAHTRNLEMFGGLWQYAPAMGGFLLFFAFASLGIPGTGNFVGELYVIAGTFQMDRALGALAALAVLFAAAYSLRLFIATMHGPVARPWRNFKDLHMNEVFALATLCIALIAIGVFPKVVTAPLHYPPDNLVPRTGRSVAPLVSPTLRQSREMPTSSSPHASLMVPREKYEIASEAAQ